MFKGSACFAILNQKTTGDARVSQHATTNTSGNGSVGGMALDTAYMDDEMDDDGTTDYKEGKINLANIVAQRKAELS